MQLYVALIVILSQMMMQVRQLSKLNVDEMETILDLSLVLQQLYLTMEANNVEDHLKNPMLLQELVNKLTEAQKIEWATYKQHIQNVNLTSMPGFTSWPTK